MSPVTYLLDENIPVSVTDAIRSADPAIGMVHVGFDSDSPRKGTLDAELLQYAEANGLAFVTFDKRSMAKHIADHLASDRHTWGVFIFPKGNMLSTRRVAEELVMIWAASQRDEWIDRTEFLPY